MSQKPFAVAGMIWGILAFVAAAAADEMPTVASQPTMEQEMQAFREPYITSKSRCEMGTNSYLVDLAYQRRFWKQSGLGVNLSMRADSLDVNGYVHNLFGLQYWGERPSRFMPWTVGWRFTAGALMTDYVGGLNQSESADIARGWGAAANLELYAIIPVFGILLDAPQARWLPHLEMVIGPSLGWIGKMKNTRDYDLNGDGVIDHHRNQAFYDADGKVIRLSYWSMSRMGLVWLI